MLSSKGFIVLHFMFRSMIHSELIFVKGVRSVSRFIFLHVDVQLLRLHWLKRIFSLFCLCSFVKGQLTVFMWVYLWVLYSVPLIYLSIISSVPHCLDYYSFIVLLEVR